MAAAPPPYAVLRGHTAEVTTARFGLLDSHGNPLLFSASSDGELRAWSLSTHRPVATVAAHAGSSVLAVHMIGGERLLSQGRDGVARVWDARDNLRGPLAELPVQSYNFCGCAPSPAAAASTDWDRGGSSQLLLALPNVDAQVVLMWDLRQHTPLPLRLAATAQQEPGSKGAGMCMSLRFVGEQLVLSGWEDGSLRLFDLRRGATPISVRPLHSEPVLCLDTSPDNSAVVSGAADCVVAVTPIRRSRAPSAAGAAGATGCSASCERGDTAEAANHADAEDAELGAPKVRLSIPTTGDAEHGGVQSVSVRPDGKLLASGGWDRRVRLWQWGKWKPLAVLQQHTGTVNAVHFSACSRYMASASNDKTIAIWNLYPPK